jgi:hypothetical protein
VRSFGFIVKTDLLAAVACTLLLVTFLGCDSSAPGSDAGDPWMNCSGARGAKLTCRSFGARVVNASRYDADRHCFSARESIADLCAAPTHCPGGGGQLTCFVHSGRAYAAYVLYGEEFSNASWHHDGNDALDSSLIDGEQALCNGLQDTLAMANSTDAGSVLVDTLNGAMAAVAPGCAD